MEKLFRRSIVILFVCLLVFVFFSFDLLFVFFLGQEMSDCLDSS